ncbi:peptidoglycan-binding domain-containing protein [Desulfosarcina ovata]|uniref:Peptidoglycan binding-like domain-containing protein n=1 Tax=Desulfosarcina ovata subsp. ovata TaxID=2752305 RepID=A0A5K8A6C0_9BACT|nr:peptidoglycan-binding domain-containing protein [Desulfosarcina ovata]BBO88011.1 hypothetical protein DSCOOX_11910 [Desulfosarcina ovata subsp. ovata]
MKFIFLRAFDILDLKFNRYCINNAKCKMKRFVFLILCISICSLLFNGCYESEYPIIDKGEKVDLSGSYKQQDKISGSIKTVKFTEQKDGIWPLSHYRYKDQDGDITLFKKLSSELYLAQESVQNGKRYEYAFVDFIDDKTALILVADLMNKGDYIEALLKKYNIEAKEVSRNDVPLLQINGNTEKMIKFFNAHDKSLMMVVLKLEKLEKEEKTKRKKQTDRGDLSESQRVILSIDKYIESYLKGEYDTLIKHDSSMYREVVNKTKKAPKQLQDKENEKYFSEKFNYIKSYEKSKEKRGTLFDNSSTSNSILQNAFGGGASFLDLMYPKINYEVMEVRDYSPSGLSECERCNKVGFVRLEYFDKEYSPYFNYKKNKKVKSCIVEVYLDKWTNKNNGDTYYKILHFKPTKYETKLFDINKNDNVEKEDDDKNKNHAEFVVNIQKNLKRLGYYNGGIDGIAGKGTISSVKAYQKDNNLKIDGKLTNSLKVHLESNTKRFSISNNKTETLENKIDKTIDNIFDKLFKK